jgi:CPA1 family monovalent cation:H+ antiporter
MVDLTGRAVPCSARIAPALEECMTLSLLELAACVLAVTAMACWLNAKVLRLPVAVGVMILGLLVSAAVAVGDRLAPGLGLGSGYGWFVGQIDYSRLVLQFMLAYLLFAGAMNVNLGALARRGVAVAVLAVVGTMITAGVIAAGFWGVAHLAGYDLSPQWALVFGVLISPTDPIAVLAMTKRTALQEELRAQIEGEALFNDGVAVVLFRTALALALAQGGGSLDFGHLAVHALVEALGGALVGLVGGVLGVLILYVVDEWATETLLTVAIATGVYALNLHFELSGPIGVVVAGLVVGSKWAERSMSERTRRYIHPFWHVVDEAMNAVLFFLLGLVAYRLKPEPAFVWLIVAAPLLVLAARWIAIALPAAALPLVGRRTSRRLVSVLTWAGVRGGLSTAMALSLPDIHERQIILAGTLAVVVFSMVVQSMTMEKLALKTGYGAPREEPQPTF